MAYRGLLRPPLDDETLSDIRLALNQSSPWAMSASMPKSRPGSNRRAGRVGIVKVFDPEALDLQPGQAGVDHPRAPGDRQWRGGGLTSLKIFIVTSKLVKKSPFAKGDKVGLFGGAGVGKTVNMMELIRNIYFLRTQDTVCEMSLRGSGQECQ